MTNAEEMQSAMKSIGAQVLDALEGEPAGMCDTDTLSGVSPTRTPGAWTVAVYLCDRAYGGPEEGGWYYDCGELAREYWAMTRVFENESAAYAYAGELNERGLSEANEGRREISSVLSEGRFEACVYDEVPPLRFPAQRPHYE